MQNNVGHEQSLKMIVKAWNFYNCLHRLLTVMWHHYAFNCQEVFTTPTTFNKQRIFCLWQSRTAAESRQLSPIQCW